MRPYQKTKKTVYILMFLFFTVFNLNQSVAQVSVNVNIGSQALWGPVGYDYVEYYYIPEADAFYYVPSGQFIYWNGNRQIFSNSLPASFNINLYSTYKVVVNKHKPYLNHGYYVSNYKKYKHGGPKQQIIRYSNDDRYYVVKGHPKHSRMKSNNYNSGGNRDQGSKHQGNKQQKNKSKK